MIINKKEGVLLLRSTVQDLNCDDDMCDDEGPFVGGNDSAGS